MVDISKCKHVHLIGIGGVGVSAIAEILIKRKIKVTGSDLNRSEITNRLENKNVEVFYAHERSNIKGADLIVYTTATNNSNPEIQGAKELGIPTVSRAEMLGLLMRDFKKSIAISGVHGKTTTTSMASLIFNNAELDPTLLIGGDVPELGGNARFGDGNIMITEACEYKDSFLSFFPNTLVILNIDEDHRDYFRDLNHIIESFTKFALNVPKKGTIIANGDDYNVQKVTSHINVKNVNVVTFGINKSVDYKATGITYSEKGYPSFNVEHNNRVISRIELDIPGVHNIYNALAAFALSHVHGIEEGVISSTLRAFKGAKRRFDILGKYNDATIIDDYAHHPTEIKATLSAAKKLPGSRIITVFQPHTYTRTRELLEDFSSAFFNADLTIVADIYAAREADPGNIHSKDLVDRISSEGANAVYIGSLDDITSFLKNEIRSGDIVFTMGAGDVYKVGYDLV